MQHTVPRDFFWRKWHSFTGFWIVLFLIEHLLTNSQAALFIGDDGSGFVRSVNFIKNLPYLPVIEIFLLGVPILVHMIWGIKYLLGGKQNAYGKDWAQPYLPEYHRNHAYNWQRITSWILVVLLVGHVIHMRFIDYPDQVERDGKEYYQVHLNFDQGLVSLAPRLGYRLDSESGEKVIAMTPDFGVATLLMIRDTFKMPVMIALYTILVLSACFHGFNGLWTFLITSGLTLTQRSQRTMLHISTVLMVLIAFLGLAAIWGTYWINLKT